MEDREQVLSGHVATQTQQTNGSRPLWCYRGNGGSNAHRAKPKLNVSRHQNEANRPPGSHDRWQKDCSRLPIGLRVEQTRCGAPCWLLVVPEKGDCVIGRSTG